MEIYLSIEEEEEKHAQADKMYKESETKMYNHNFGPFRNNNESQPDMCGFEVTLIYKISLIIYTSKNYFISSNNISEYRIKSLIKLNLLFLVKLK